MVERNVFLCPVLLIFGQFVAVFILRDVPTLQNGGRLRPLLRAVLPQEFARNLLSLRTVLFHTLFVNLVLLLENSDGEKTRIITLLLCHDAGQIETVQGAAVGTTRLPVDGNVEDRRADLPVPSLLPRQLSALHEGEDLIGCHLIDFFVGFLGIRFFLRRCHHPCASSSTRLCVVPSHTSCPG